MTGTRALIVQVVRSSARNRTATIFTLGLAVLFMVIFGELFKGGGVNLTVGVVDRDNGTAASAGLVRDLRATAGVTVETGAQNTEEDRLRKGKVGAVVVIPAGYAAALGAEAGGTPLAVTIEVPDSTSAQSAVARQLLGGVVFAQNHIRPAVVAQTQVTSVNPINSVDFFLPSMIAYIALQSGINYVAIGLVDMRARKVLRRLRATPLRPAQILTANVVGGVLTVLLQIAVLVVLGLTLFQAHNYGSWVLTTLVVILGACAFVGIGFLLTSAARTSESARGLASMIALPMMFLSGIFFPVDALPAWLQSLVHILPLTWLSDALHQIMNNGEGIGTIALDCLVLALWGGVTLALATWRFRWD